jgi:NADH-quinone oxidoreductase subunit C/D
MHPSWFRIGGVAHDLPGGWQKLVRDFLDYFPKRIREFEKVTLQNTIFKARTIGIGAYTKAEAIEWGVTGAGLRSTGFEWDYRKKTLFRIGKFESISLLEKMGCFTVQW